MKKITLLFTAFLCLAIHANAQTNPATYHGSEVLEIDLIHTELSLEIDMEDEVIKGSAILTMTPYFYPVNQIEISATQMSIMDIQINGESAMFVYDKDNEMLTIPVLAQRSDTFDVRIDYEAFPNNIDTGKAIKETHDRGFFFVTLENGQKIAYTHGQTNHNSTWMPTLLAPNNRHEQTFHLTVDKKYKTVSNGKLSYTMNNEDGTRTDTWELGADTELEHPTYLSFIAIGQFTASSYQCEDIEMNLYYRDKDHSSFADSFLIASCDMLQFFERTFGDYPWKPYGYNQILLDSFFIIGMENTTITALTEDTWYLPYGMRVIIHEIAHQWFGDAVTCSNWANSALNESMARYGEYIYFEYSQGKEFADSLMTHHIIPAYYRVHDKGIVEEIINYHYHETNGSDMFGDLHGITYDKGAVVINMLRGELGNNAFFEGLRKYFTDNTNTSVESEDFQKAFEQVSGRDLHWFFDQWFHHAGHPVIEYVVKYNDITDILMVELVQVQEGEGVPDVFTLPLEVGVWENGEYDITSAYRLNTKESTLVMENITSKEIIFDPHKKLLCKFKEKK